VDFLNQRFQRKILLRKYSPSYGPRYPGIKGDVKDHDILTVTARQWTRGSRKAREDLASLGQGRVFLFRYEDLMQDTETVLRGIYDHCGLACSDEIVLAAKAMVDPGRQEKWRRLDLERLKAIIPEVRDEMAVYGYDIPTSLR
jgi:Sulfotransferase family